MTKKERKLFDTLFTLLREENLSVTVMEHPAMDGRMQAEISDGKNKTVMIYSPYFTSFYRQFTRACEDVDNHLHGTALASALMRGRAKIEDYIDNNKTYMTFLVAIADMNPDKGDSPICYIGSVENRIFAIELAIKKMIEGASQEKGHVSDAQIEKTLREKLVKDDVAVVFVTDKKAAVAEIIPYYYDPSDEDELDTAYLYALCDESFGQYTITPFDSLEEMEKEAKRRFAHHLEAYVDKSLLKKYNMTSDIEDFDITDKVWNQTYYISPMLLKTKTDFPVFITLYEVDSSLELTFEDEEEAMKVYHKYDKYR